MKQIIAIQIAHGAAEDARSYLSRAMDESWSYVDRMQWAHFARRDLGEGILKFLENDGEEEYRDLFFEMKLALREMCIGYQFGPSGKSFFAKADQTLFGLLRKIDILQAALDTCKGGAA